MDLAGTGLLAIVGLILVKEAGLPIPVPGDLIVIGAGVAAGRGDMDPAVALVALVVASIVGGVIQFGLLRSVARPALLRLLSRVTTTERIDGQTERLRRGGARSVAIARSTPGVRIVAIAAERPRRPAGGGLRRRARGSATPCSSRPISGWATCSASLSCRRSAARSDRSPSPASPWPFSGRSAGSSSAGGGGAELRPLAVVGDWADACCPACLALAVADARRPARA